jgi:uncharacterized protein DUF5666
MQRVWIVANGSLRRARRADRWSSHRREHVLDSLHQWALGESSHTNHLVVGALKVSVNGTNIETNVDGTGHFTLNGVPSGTIVLSFTGRGVDASVTLRGVSTGDQIEIEVRLEGSGARVESENRHRREGNGEDDDDDDDENEEVRTLPDGTMKLEGAALSLSGACPALTFGLASKIVKTNSSTIFDDIRCSSITNMTRLEVLGRPQGDGTILATKVERED